MKANEVLEILKISRATLTKYVQSGLIVGHLKQNGQYDYDSESVLEFAKQNPTGNINGLTIAYTRAVSDKYINTIQTLSDRIEEYAKANKIKIDKTLYDINDGHTLNRKNLQELISEVCNYHVSCVIIKNKSVLSISSFDMLEQLFKSFNCEIIIADEFKKTDDIDIIENLIDVIDNSQKQISSKKLSRKLRLIIEDLQNEID